MPLLIMGAAKAVSSMGVGELAFMDNIRKLNRLKGPVVQSSLITQNEKLQEIQMHRLVQQSCHLRMQQEARQRMFDMAFAIIKTMWPVPERNNRHRVDLWPIQQAYFSHVQSLTSLYQSSQEDTQPLIASKEFAWLLTHASL